MSCLVCLHIRFQVLEEENGPWTVPIVTAIALGPIGLFPVLHHIGTVTIGTLHLHKSHSTSPTRNCGICAQSYQAINSIKTLPSTACPVRAGAGGKPTAERQKWAPSFDQHSGHSTCQTINLATSWRSAIRRR